MASVFAGKWREGDRCRAPDPRDGTLREASIQRLNTSHNNDSMAWVVFTDRDKDQEEEEEEALPLSKLMRPVLNHSDEEIPVFSSSVIDSRLCVPLELSDVDGDRVPYTINRYLRDYQREGIRFIYNNYRSSRGCILGDDMGLGKTVQVIGFLAAVLHKTGTWQDVENNRPQFLQSQMPYQQSKPNKVFLIVAPLSVLYNWKDELNTWGNFQCAVVHGLRKEEELDRIKKGRIEIVLTTYETLRICLDQFNNISWSAVVADEAHKIKNPNSKITQAMKDLKCEIRIGLTGTILQNNLDELWCVMDWAIPGCLGSLRQFKNKFSDPVEQGQRHSATKRALATGRKLVKTLVRKISHWFLRRTKALIKEQLPRKDDRMVYCSLTNFQQSVYQTVLDTEDMMLLLRSSEKCDCQSGSTRRRCCYKTNSDGVKIKELYFSYLAILRKVANHVALLKSTAGTSKKQNMYVAGICSKVFQKFPDFVQGCKDEAFEALSNPMYSGKMRVLQKLLKYYLQKRDNKILLFSLSTKLLNVLESYCMAEGLDYSRLDGKTKAKERVQIVREFNSSPHIALCLVSTMAGGLGLNFVGANVVVLFDPTWNPANDLQAVDRVYRIGQCRDVTILRLISLGTVEEVIYLRQVYKQQLHSSVVGNESARRYFEAVRGSGVHRGELFGIKNLFRLQTEGTSLTRKILEREGQVEVGVMTTSNHTGTEEGEETKGVSESRDVPPRDGPAMNDEPAMEKRYGSMVSRGCLDFSSASEEDEDKQGSKMKTSNTGAASGIRSRNAATCSLQLSLLQHGFSNLLERVKGNPELGEGDSGSCVDDSPVEEDGYHSSSIICQRSNSGNNAMCRPKLGKTTYDRSSSSDGEYGENGDRGREERNSLMKQNNDSVKKRPDLQGRKNEGITVDEESFESSSPDTKKPNKFKNRNQKMHHLEYYSDESEDLDIEEVSRNASKSHVKGGIGERERLDRKKKRPFFRHKARSTYSEDIETFTSSQDEHTPVKKGRTTHSRFTSPVETPKDNPKSERANRAGKQAGMSKFTNLFGKVASKDHGGTIDSVLGGVQEVMHIHSNQRVVGGSKAEELISRAAVRDTFERKLFSQLPANHILDSIESLSGSLQDTRPCSSPVRLEKPSVDHPVTFSNKSVHHTRLTTIIIGETPTSIRRKLLEEMAKNLKFSSVHQFAMEIVRGNSTQRLTWLRQHYTSLDKPGLANIVTNNFPQPHSTEASSSSIKSTKIAATKCQADTRAPQKDIHKASKKAKHNSNNPDPKSKPVTQHSFVTSPQKNPINLQNGVQEPQKKLRISHEDVQEPLSDVPGLESEEQEETVCKEHTRTKKGSVSHSRAFRGGGGLGLDQAGCSGFGSWEATPLLNRRDTGTPSSPDAIHSRFTKLCKPKAQQKEQEQKSSRTSKTPQGQRENLQAPFPPEKTSASSPRSFLSDLIGDTSILDDLLKPKSRAAQVSGTSKTPFAMSSATASTSFPKLSPSTINFNTDSGSAETSDTRTSPKPKTIAMQQANSKSSHKDFWDILNEGNEETINRLTDPAEVHKVCINTKFTARRRSTEEDQKSLWKMNERFLWKK